MPVASLGYGITKPPEESTLDQAQFLVQVLAGLRRVERGILGANPESEISWRPAHANPLNGREVVGAALNRLLRLAFTMVKNQTYYISPQLAQVTG
ncbi:hypothetical protein ACFLUK_00585 [Chloroflexota bacterium]